MPTDAELRAMFDRATILRPGVRHTGGPIRIRSASSPDGILCCYGPCEDKADDRYTVKLPHETPRFEGEKVVWAFCSPRCRALWCKGTPLSKIYR